MPPGAGGAPGTSGMNPGAPCSGGMSTIPCITGIPGTNSGGGGAKTGTNPAGGGGIGG